MTSSETPDCFTLLTHALSTDARSDPSAAAAALKAFLQSFLELSDSDRQAVRDLLTAPEARKMASLSVPAAEEALLVRNEEWLTWSLLAHDVEQFRDNPRDNLRLLAVTTYATEQLGLAVRPFLEHAAAAMSPRSASFIRDFAARPPALRSLAVMGVRALTEDGKIRFEF